MSLEEHGYSIVPTAIPDDRLIRLRNTLFHESTVGERCLLDRDIVREVAMDLKRELSAQNHLPLDAPAIQAIAFDKTASTNWKVAWHQDLMFPFANKVSSADFDLPCIKDGVHYARPPEFVLKQLLAVRLHLDDCDETNGPLRVSPGTHNLGIMKTAAISDLLTRHGETIGYYIPTRPSRNQEELNTLKQAAMKLEAMMLALSVSEDDIVAEFNALRTTEQE